MSDVFPLRVLTPIGIVFDGETAEVTAVGPLGQFGVLPEHINFITSLMPGILEIRRTREEPLRYVVAGGLAEVRDGAMTVLADSTEDPESIDSTEAGERLAAAEARIAEMSFYAAEFEDMRCELMLARARQSVADLRIRR